MFPRPYSGWLGDMTHLATDSPPMCRLASEQAHVDRSNGQTIKWHTSRGPFYGLPCTFRQAEVKRTSQTRLS